MASRDTLFTPWPKYLIRARAHGTLEGARGSLEWPFSFICICTPVLCGFVVVFTCFLQSGQLVWVPRAGALMCHSGSFETVSRAHWARGGAPRCTATLGRNVPCGTQAGAFGQSGAARNLRTEGWSGEEIDRYVENQMSMYVCVSPFNPVQQAVYCCSTNEHCKTLGWFHKPSGWLQKLNFQAV